MKMLVVHMHWIVHIRMKYLTNARSFFVYFSQVYVVVGIIDIHSFPAQLGWSTLYTSRKFILVIFAVYIIWCCLMVIGATEPIKTKSSLMYWPWWRIEVENNRAVNNISENVYAMRLIVEIIKFNFWSCVHHVKCLADMNLMERVDKDLKWTSLGSNPVC